jgi:hypothetical protein
LFGLLTEIGPLILSDESLQTDDYRSTDIPTPIYNPYTWTRLGTLLIIDQPAPVGFSYCNNDTTSHSCGGIGWTDELTSLNAYTALQTFFTTKFPCLSSKQLYLTGESYGGIYIPTLARRIVQDTNSTLDLKGFAVGDGCLGKFWKKKRQRNSFTVRLMGSHKMILNASSSVYRRYSHEYVWRIKFLPGIRRLLAYMVHGRTSSNTVVGLSYRHESVFTR